MSSRVIIPKHIAEDNRFDTVIAATKSHLERQLQQLEIRYKDGDDIRNEDGVVVLPMMSLSGLTPNMVQGEIKRAKLGECMSG